MRCFSNTIIKRNKESLTEYDFTMIESLAVRPEISGFVLGKVIFVPSITFRIFNRICKV